MQYRKMGSLNWKVSALGFGAMRLPVKSSWSDIDYDKATEMVRYAIDHGVNYVDTAYIYHEGKSEEFLGVALQDGYRDKIKLTSKSPIGEINTPSDFHAILDTSLERLQTNYLDTYLFHGINGNVWNKIQELDLLHEMEEARAMSKIKNIGFSFHGSYDAFKEIIDAYPWDVTQIQYNYLDTNFQATTKGLDYAAAKKIAVVIMEPLRGGKLTEHNPEIDEILQSIPIKRELPELGFRFIWNHPGVSVVLSGMSNLQQVKDNLRYAEKASPKSLSTEESQMINQIKEIYRAKIKVPCTFCTYCMPCPQDVYIPENFNLMNQAAWFGRAEDWIQGFYNNLASRDEPTDWERKGKASRCVQCGECLEKCPQHIDIPTELENVRLVFEEGYPITDFLNPKSNQQ